MEQNLPKQDIKLYFLSPYANPNIHISYDTEYGKKWFTIPMKKSKKQRELYVYRPEHFQKIMFIFCSEDKQQWYHPDQQKSKQKYFIKNCEKDQTQGNHHFFLNQKLFSENKKKLNFARFLIFDGITISLKKHILDKQLAIISDLDDTMVCHQNSEPQNKFKKFYLKHFLLQNTVKLIYNTGRCLQLWKELQKDENLLIPHYLIVESGTRIFDCSKFEDEKTKQGKVVNKQFIDKIMENWDANIVKKVVEEYLPWVAQHPLEQKNDTRVSYIPYTKDIKQNYDQIEKTFQILKNQHNINAKYIISGEGDYQFLDIVSVNADKGNATIFCVKELIGMDMKNSVSFGDSKNDCQMLKVTGKSFLVKNAQESLKKWLKEADQKNHDHISISSMEFSYAIILYLKEYFNL